MPSGKDNASIHFVIPKWERAYFVGRCERLAWSVSQGGGVVFHDWIARGAAELHPIEQKLPPMPFEAAWWKNAVEIYPDLIKPRLDRAPPKTAAQKEIVKQLKEKFEYGA